MAKTNKKRLSLKTVYYSSFLSLVVVPIIVVMIVALTILNQVFRRQSVENIMRAQDTVKAELLGDIEQISRRLSHMAYTNNSELLAIAAKTDTEDPGRSYENMQKLNEAASYATEPVKDIISVAFYMRDGRQTFFKNDIQIPMEEIREELWYRNALEKKNRVMIGSYNTNETEIYLGGSRDSLVLVSALAPDVSLDRSQKIEMVAFFQVTGAADKIKSYNSGYRQRKNKIGYTRIVDGSGNIVYQPFDTPQEDFKSKEYTRVTSSLELFGNDWKIESYIKTSELTQDYWAVAGLLLFAMMVVLALYFAFSRYFLKRIIQPIQQMCQGLKQVEEGMLEVHLTPSGQYEIRTMIHSFNAMVRRLKALIAGYEERVKHAEKTGTDYLAALIKGDMSPEAVMDESKDFFPDRYALITVMAGKYKGHEGGLNQRARELAAEFDTIPRFASRCTLYLINPYLFLVYYRIGEENPRDSLNDMAKEMQKVGKGKMGVELSVCIGQEQNDYHGFTGQVEEMMGFHDLYTLSGEGSILHLGQDYGSYVRLMEMTPDYAKLAAALYIADEKTISEEKESIFQAIQSEEFEEAKLRILSVILATARQFINADADFFDIFGQKINYFEKIRRIEDIRSLRLWVTNYFSWVTDYISSKLEVAKTDAITRAKHYVMEHYQDSSLTLKEVADYVDLSEKYFTTKFTKECGETFLSYLTGLRVQKAKELIRTTTFKMYEIAEMVGYNNPEHFNRIFKKAVGVSPAQYRKGE